MIVSAREALSVLLAMGRKRAAQEGPIQTAQVLGADEVNRYKNLITAAPLRNDAKLSHLKTAVRDNSYRIDDYEIASKIFERYLVDSLCAKPR